MEVGDTFMVGAEDSQDGRQEALPWEKARVRVSGFLCFLLQGYNPSAAL